MDLVDFLLKSLLPLISIAGIGLILIRKKKMSHGLIGSIKVLESVRLAQDMQLALVEIQGKKTLLAMTANAIQVLECENA